MPDQHQHTGQAFEAAIEHHLLSVASYTKADPMNFNRERALTPSGMAGSKSAWTDLCMASSLSDCWRAFFGDPW